VSFLANVKTSAEDRPGDFVRGLGLLDSTMLVAGSMIGSGIFIVSADIARQVGSPGLLLLVWLLTGLLTVAGALSYAELAAMMPKAGGVYVYLREAFSPLWGFLYGWTFFLVIQTGALAAVSVAFAVYLDVLIPNTDLGSSWIIRPVNLSADYAISLSWQQLVAILLLVTLTAINLRGIKLASMVQNAFTFAKALSLAGLISVCILGYNADAVARNFGDFWTPRGVSTISPDFGFIPAVTAASGAFGLFVAFCAAQVGSVFSADGWYFITFTAGEVKNPRRNIPLSLVAGTVLVISLYMLVNLAYLITLPFSEIQAASSDRVATAAVTGVVGGAGTVIMAIAIMISTFGCNNGTSLGGARVFYTMARDGLFFRSCGTLNDKRVPGVALILQCIWASMLVLPRTRSRDGAGGPVIDGATGFEQYGNLYGSLLGYVVTAILIFFVLTIIALFVLRSKRPDAERPYRAWGYPVLPALYILAASAIITVLALYKTQTTWPGLLIVMTGFPVYFLWRRANSGEAPAV
jgi:APA family basic amino acid/polyamine antiporter